MTADGTALRARPTVYNGIPMRSRLEARVAAWLDSLGIEWRYEPHAFASPAGQYLPDFELVGSPLLSRFKRRAFLEVKGAFDAHTYLDTRERMAIVLESAPGAVLMMADADTLEAGQVDCFNLGGPGWSDEYLVAVLVRLNFIALPAGWCLPAWAER